MKNTAKVLFGAVGLSLLLASCNTATTPQSAAQAQVRAPQAVSDLTLTTDVATATHNIEPQIMYGTVSARGARPYQVYLSIAKNGAGYMCGGSLIANNWVLTAAHCLKDAQASGVKVRAGINKLSDYSQGQTIQASALYVHPKYTGTSGGYDIALIKLSSNVNNPYASVIKLPNNSVESVLDVAGKRAIVSGWGTTEKAGSSDDLLEVNLPIVPNPTTCNGRSPANTICGTQENKKDSCTGDSGGPLAQSYNGSYYVLGIVSYGPTACTGNGIYTRVNAYLDWIKSVSGVAADGTTATPSNPTPTPTPTAPKTNSYTGYLSQGQVASAPSEAGFYYNGGTLKATLSADAGTDFDLYLQRLDNGQWLNAAYSAEAGTSSESITYKAAAGTYRWQIQAYSGNGNAQILETK